MSEGINESVKPKIKFRNYTPYDSSLLADKKEKDLKSIEGPPLKSTEALPPSTVTQSIDTKILVPTVDPIKQELDNVTLQIGNKKELNIVPKKINWDLKRHSEYKIEKLRKRTQRAIVEILREKLASEGSGDVDDTSDEDVD